ncbi:haloacid dehalogenase-like hydrolase domain-containing protein 3 [Ptychodera flava]|uniref:haloacid dehalogenase-like hydrolase domain-containing protein 3 n=1 Tax=Ptychodera flava TaxID=63121 RepID=UPI003969FE53
MTSSGIKLLTVDVTNTLIRIRISVGHQYTRVASQFGFQYYQEELLTNSFKEQYKKLWDAHPNFGQQDGSMTPTEWWKLIVKRTFTNAYRGYENLDLEPLADKLFHEFSTSRCWEIFPDVKETMPKIQATGVGLCVLSNTDSRKRNILKELDLMKYFSDVVLSGENHTFKPQSEIFKLAMERSNVKPSECVHVGDDVEADYKAARNVGMSAYLIDRKGKLANSSDVDEKHILKDLSQLVDVLS